MKNKADILRAMLLKPVDSATLAVFRILFGAFMFIEMLRYFIHKSIFYYYIHPGFYFTFEFMPWLSPLPGNGMYYLFGLLAICALGICTGIFYRASCLIFFLGYTYIFLLDKSNYNNHYYLISLLSFLFIFLDANRSYSISKKRQQQSVYIPFWQVFILRAQIFIVYFYGGIAKLNTDWLAGEPVRTWLRYKKDTPFIGPFFETEAAVLFFSYGGLFFDLVIGFLLIIPATRLIAIPAILFFNLMNNWMFVIGIFPFVMMGTIVLFLEPQTPRHFFGWLKEKIFHIKQTVLPLEKPVFKNKTALVFVFIFLLIQVTLPLRHWFFKGNVSWTEKSHNFSWHMKLRDKQGEIKFFVSNPITGETQEINLHEHLTGRQISKMKIRPDMILQFAHNLRDKYQQEWNVVPVVRTEALVSLNARPAKYIVYPNLNLSNMEFTFFKTPYFIMNHDEKSTWYELLLTLLTLILAGTILLRFVKEDNNPPIA